MRTHTGEWRRLYNKELYGLYSSPNIIQLITSRKIGACGKYGGHERCIQGFGAETLWQQITGKT
jgi:hypothetical protein